MRKLALAAAVAAASFAVPAFAQDMSTTGTTDTAVATDAQVDTAPKAPDGTRAFGIEPTRLRFLVVKSMQHFRAAFEPLAAKVIVCDSGALATPRAELRPYVRVRRPIWPLDK